uniref:acyl-CoA oxidase n=1 Tax=Aplanochytrium stocchinoi TaxID=215587 RepID=A0A6S8AL55_9STRA
MGKTSTHCLVYANLIIEGREYGFHVFMVQLRDENHRPLPGVEPGEVGPKYGDNGTETGFLRLFNVHIPRNWMLMKNQQVLEDGSYVKEDKNSKAQYGTMLSIRAGLVMGAGYRLAQGVTIAVRYSCVRHQGFTNTQGESNRANPEHPIIHYQNQQYRLFKQLSLAYAFVFTGKSISDKFQKTMGDLATGDTSDLPEMHATSAGLKALCTFEGASGLEECRKCCGGHGVLLASGVSQMTLDYTTYCTAEGDRIILELQSARYLIKMITEARSGATVHGMADYLNEAGKIKIGEVDPSVYLQYRADTDEDFKDLKLLSSLFRNRALVFCVETADRLNSLIKDGLSYDDAWNSCAVDLVKCSRVHCYYVILQNFVSQINAIEDMKVKRILICLCQLYALINIMEDLGSFELTHKQKGLVRSVINQLLKEVRVDCVPLVDAFEFPVSTF